MLGLGTDVALMFLSACTSRADGTPLADPLTFTSDSLNTQHPSRPSQCTVRSYVQDVTNGHLGRVEARGGGPLAGVLGPSVLCHHWPIP